MATIGRDSAIDSPVFLGSGTAHKLDDVLDTYVAVPGDTVTEVGWYSNAGSGKDVEVGVYRLDTNAKVGSALVTGAAAGRNVASVSFALATGVEYGVAFRVASDWAEVYSVFEGDNGYWKNGSLTGSSALPSTLTESGEAQARYSVFATVSAGATAPVLTAGPTVSNLASTGFDVAGTADANCTAALVVKNFGATAPTTGEYDASTETASVTAGTPFSIHHTGQ